MFNIQSSIVKYPTEAEYAKICERPQMDVSQLNSIVAGVLADIRRMATRL